MGLQTYFLFALYFVSLDGIRVETKLDFQSEEKPKYLGRLNQTEKQVGKKKDEFNIGIVCVSGGCNTTKTKLEASEPILTDVVVEVKTNVESPTEGKSKSIEDVPDVPIVVGYSGIPNNPATNTNPSDNVLNPNPIILTNMEYAFPDVKNGNNFLPPLIVPKYNDNPYYERPYITQRNGYYNPLDFNRIPKPDWRTPVPWFNRRNFNNHSNNNYNRNYNRNYPRTTTQSPWTTCTCHQRAAWLPTTASYQPLYKQSPGAQVNDKLAPLN